MSRASFSICGSVASAAAISRGISTRPCTSLASSSSDNSPRALPAATASAASTISWQVKALVEATPISGPASVGSTVSLSRAMVEVGTLTTESVCSALRLGVAQRRQRIGGLAGLRNEDREIALAQRRFAIAEFGGDIDFDRHAGRAARTSIWRRSRHSSRCRRPRSRCAGYRVKSNGSLTGSATRSVAMST